MKPHPHTGRLLLLLSLLAAALRWVTRVHRIYGWDSVHYLLAQDRYDLLAHQPHPPGSYYYVLLARTARMVTGDPHTSLLLVSSLLGGAAVWVLYRLAQDLWESEEAGWIAAVLGATSPLLWFYGSVGLNYGPSGTLSALVALGCMQACRPRPASKGLWLGGAALGLLGGFRPTDVVFLMPAYLWALGCAWRGGVRGRHLLAGPVLMGVLTLGWLVPNLVNTGGVEGYLKVIESQEHLLARSSVLLAGWPALEDALRTHRRSLESLIGAAWLPLLLGLFAWTLRAFPHRAGAEGKRSAPAVGTSQIALGGLIVAPAFLFYLLGHFNSPGYALSYGGYLLAVAAGLLVKLPGRTLNLNPRRLVAGLAMLALGNALIFLLGWPGASRLGQRSLSAAELRDHDRYYGTLEAYLQQNYPPAGVRLLSSWNSTDGLRIVEALLPERADEVAQAVGYIPELPPLFSHLRWLRLMTPAQIRAEGRPVLAIYRTREDPGYHESLFPGQWEKVPIGSGYLIYRLRGTGQ